MTITVTGGSGFLGTALVRTLLELGHVVRVLDLVSPDPSISERVTFFQGDISDPAVVKRAIAGSGVVYHIAAIVPIAKKSRSEFLSINAQGTQAVLQASLETGARIVFCSTSSPLYDRVDTLPVTEATPQTPGYAYGHSKQAAEAMCREYRERGALVAIVRPRMIIGPGRLGLIQILSEWIHQGKPIPLLGGGKNRLQLLDVADLVEFLVLLVDATPKTFNDDYNIGTRTFATLKDDIEYVIETVKSASRTVAIPRFYRPLLVLFNSIGFTPITFFHLNTIDRDFYFDTAKAERALGWSSRYSNAEALLRSYEWYHSHKHSLSVGEGHSHTLKTWGVLAAVPAILSLYERMHRVGGWLAEFIATGFGIGKIAHIAPSSHGALLGMTVVPFFLLAPWQTQLGIIVLSLLFGTYISHVTERRLNKKDARPIVIDEVVSVFITFFAVPFAAISLPILILGFVLNRIFDIIKPFPARSAESLPYGLGIMADDVVSGIYSWIALSVIVALLL